MYISKMYLLRVLSLIWELNFSVSGMNMSGRDGGGEGLEPRLYVPLKVICASKDTFFLVH